MLTAPVSFSRPVNAPSVSMSSVSPDELEMPLETPPDSRVLIIRQPDRLWIPGGTCSLPPHCSLGMPYGIAAALAIEMNRRAMTDPVRCDGWHVVISRQNKTGYSVMRVQRSSNWIPQDEYDLPPDASEPVQNCDARRSAREFNRREMQMNRSPEFWAIHVKPLKKESASCPKLDISRDSTRVVRVNGRNDIHLVVQGVFSDSEAVQKLRDAVLPLIR